MVYCFTKNIYKISYKYMIMYILVCRDSTEPNRDKREKKNNMFIILKVQ